MRSRASCAACRRTPLRVLAARIRGVVRKAQFEREIDEELRCHLRRRVQEKIAAPSHSGGSANGSGARVRRRSRIPLQRLMDAVRYVVQTLDKTVPIYDARLMDEYIDDVVAQPRLNSILLSTFAIVALVLNAIGLRNDSLLGRAATTRDRDSPLVRRRPRRDLALVRRRRPHRELVFVDRRRRYRARFTATEEDRRAKRRQRCPHRQRRRGLADRRCLARLLVSGAPRRVGRSAARDRPTLKIYRRRGSNPHTLASTRF